MKYAAMFGIIALLHLVLFPAIGYQPDIFTSILIGVVIGVITVVIDD